MLLGERIKELREQHGVLQRQLAALLEIDTTITSTTRGGTLQHRTDRRNETGH